MNRPDLVARIRSHFLGLTDEDMRVAVATILSAVSTRLAEGGRAEIRGFGSFTLNYRPPKIGRNPKTGVTVSVQAKYTPHFKPGMELRRRVNKTAKGGKTGAGAKPRKREEMERAA